ncbi:MAG: radical SAM protein [Candidatus Omnitrophota bacterium]|jgi:radical SAM superfamily enzyme YgiQ (UPF0313 family)
MAGNKQSRILLIFPPMAEFQGPFLSIPTLTAFLRQKSYRVIQRDLNVEIMDSLLTKERLRASFEKGYGRFKDLKENNKRGLLFSSLAEILFSAPHAIENTDTAKSILRDKKRFYSYKQYSWSADIIYKALKLILCENYLFHKRAWVKSVTELMEVVKDEEINPFIGIFKEKAVPSILREEPSLIGISVTYYTQLAPAFTLARLIKEKKRNVHICMGGSLISKLSGRLAENRDLFSMVDSFIVNEGEYSLLELVRRIESGSNFAGVPNLVYRENGRIMRNNEVFIENLDSLPTPDFDGLPLEQYLSPEPVIPLLTSRGCYWGKCAFCDIAGGVKGHLYRPRNTDLVIEDIRALSSRYDTKYFSFSDVAVSPSALVNLSQAIIRDGMDVKWQCEARLEKEFTLRTCRLMYKGGCRNITFGLESTCRRVLEKMRKGTDPVTIKKVLKNFHRVKIKNNLQFFIGFPTETRQEAYQTLNFILKNKAIIDSVSLGGTFQLFEDAFIFKMAEKYGIDKIYRKNRDNLELQFAYRVKSGMSPREARKIAPLFRAQLNSFYPFSCMFPTPNFNEHRLLFSSHCANADEK